jgi:hypothetical protein
MNIKAAVTVFVILGLLVGLPVVYGSIAISWFANVVIALFGLLLLFLSGIGLYIFLEEVVFTK